MYMYICRNIHTRMFHNSGFNPPRGFLCRLIDVLASRFAALITVLSFSAVTGMSSSARMRAL